MFVSIANLSFAQQVEFKNWRRFGLHEGLSGSNIRKIIEDSNGFLWIATQDGLDRFDGSRFVVYNAGVPDSTHATGGSDFHDITLDLPDNAIWAASSNGPVQKIDIASGKILLTVHTGGQGADLPIYQILVTKSSSVAVSNDGWLIMIDKASGKVTRKKNMAALLGIKDMSVEGAIMGNDNKIWLLVNGYGLLVFDADWNLYRKLPAQALFPGIHPAALSFNGSRVNAGQRAVITTSAGIIAFNLANGSRLNIDQIFGGFANQLSHETVYGLTFAGRLVYLSSDKGFYCYDTVSKISCQLLPAADPGKRNDLNSAYAVFASQNIICAGTRDAIFLAPVTSPFTAFYASFDGSGIKIAHANQMLALNDSIVYCSAYDGLYETNTITGAIRCLNNTQAFYMLTKCPDGHILASGEKNMFVIEGHTLAGVTTVYPELSAIKNDFIISAEIYRDSLIFMASQLKKGIYIWDFRKRKVGALTLASAPSLKDAEINNMHIAGNGKLGIVCKSVYSLYDINHKTITHHNIIDPVAKRPASLLMDACNIGDDFYVAAYGAGIIKASNGFNNYALVSWEHGLSDNGLYKMYNIGDSAMFVSSNNGLFYYDLKKGRLKKITAEDGLQSGEFEEASGYATGRYIYFGGPGGFTRIDRFKFGSDSAPPKCWISSTAIKFNDGKEQEYGGLFQEKLIIPPDYSQVDINLSGILFPAAHSVRYAYKIKKTQEAWQQLGTQNFINLIGVGHGEYELEAVAMDADGRMSNVCKLALVFMPHWYETWWFNILVITAAALFICGLFLLRIRQLKREQNIRIKLAGDLHDDLGGTINSVKVYTNLAILEQEPQKYLPLIKSSVQEAVTSIKDLIWVLDDKYNDVEGLAARINAFAQPLCDASGIIYLCEIRDGLHARVLKRDEKRSLYMMMKEAINNAIKYSEASKIIFVAADANKKLLFTVTDDGKGFDVTKANSGNGIKNMHWRSAHMKYSCVISSAENAGTTVCFSKA